MPDAATKIDLQMARLNARLENYVPGHRIEPFPRKHRFNDRAPRLGR